jgi:hypothetical protein
MSLPLTAAGVLRDHVTLTVESIDRMRLNVRQPRLQYAAGVHGFFVNHRGHKFASPALMEPMTKRFVADVAHFIETHGIVGERFFPGQRKDDVTQRYLGDHDGSEKVLYVGFAQERARTWTATRRTNPVTGAVYTWIQPATRMVNWVYFYCFDAEFGPFLFRVCTYFPFDAQLIINAHHWVQQQASKSSLGFTALDNGFAGCEDPAALQAICDTFAGEHIEALLAKWQRILPAPFTEEDEILGGYEYLANISQIECAITHMLDRPVSGRIFLDQVFHDNLDIGRPNRIGLIFNRRIVSKGKHKTPGVFRTRVLTAGVDASLHIDYKSTSIKQYHKEGKAIRTEITINNPHDFRVPKWLSSLPQLRQLGFAAARRLLDVQRISHDPILGANALDHITRPIIHSGHSRVPALRFDDPRVQSLLRTVLIFGNLVHGFTNRDVRTHIAPLRGTTADAISAGAITYDLRRLREHGIIERIPGSMRYLTTDLGHRVALLFTHAHDHLLRTGLAELDHTNSDLHHAANSFKTAFTNLASRAHLPTSPAA